MSDCLISFEQNGFDSTAAESIIKLLPEADNTPLSDILQGSSEIEKLTVILGALVNFSRRAADTVSRLFGVRPGSITPEAVCELFLGVSDIFPMCEYLSQYGILDRVFDGEGTLYKPENETIALTGGVEDGTSVTATEACGISVRRRIFYHLIPNVIPQLIVICTMDLGSTILTEATLSFLGLGVKFPFASWGNIINDVNNSFVMTNYWFIWIPAGICLLVSVLGFNFIGDGLRDAFDPKMKR